MSEKSKDPLSWMLKRPLQLEKLRGELPETRQREETLNRLQRLRENLDAVVYALSNRSLAEDRRRQLLEILGRHQRALDECLQEVGITERDKRDVPLWYFNQLDPMARQHLAAILEVPQEPEYYDILDIKAAEYLAQYEAFDTLAGRMGFKEQQALEANAKHPVLLLTLSGSLVQLSSPLSDKGERRYRYQNIYGNTHPPEGILILDRDLRLGHRMRSVELTSSPVRLLRVHGHKVSWRKQSKTFEEVAQTMSSLISRANSQIAESGWVEASTSLQRQVNPEAAHRVLQEEYAETFSRYEALRQGIIDGGQTGDGGAQRVEAELLALCHRLQRAAMELGFEALSLGRIQEFVTEGEYLYQVDALKPDRITLAGPGDRPEVIFTGVSVGRQSVTRHAPLALISEYGGVGVVPRPGIRFSMMAESAPRAAPAGPRPGRASGPEQRLAALGPGQRDHRPGGRGRLAGHGGRAPAAGPGAGVPPGGRVVLDAARLPLHALVIVERLGDAGRRRGGGGPAGLRGPRRAPRGPMVVERPGALRARRGGRREGQGDARRRWRGVGAAAGDRAVEELAQAGPPGVLRQQAAGQRRRAGLLAVGQVAGDHRLVTRQRLLHLPQPEQDRGHPQLAAQVPGGAPQRALVGLQILQQLRRGLARDPALGRGRGRRVRLL